MNNSVGQPVFSIIIPTYNRAHLLPRAIYSVLNQTSENFELIVVDDASPNDQTKEVIEIINDNRIIYLRNERNSGVSATRNAGIQKARGKYISFLDDDDELLPSFLEETKQILEIAPEDVGFCWCGTRWIKNSSNGEQILSEYVWQPTFKDRKQAYLAFLKSRRIGTNCGLTIRRCCFDVIGMFDEACKKAEDTDLLIRLAHQFDFVVIPSILVNIYLHEGPHLRVYNWEAAIAYERIIQKNIAALIEHPELWTELHYKTGWLHYYSGNKKAGRRYILKAIQKKTSYLKGWTALLLYETLGPWASSVHKYASTWKAHFRGGFH